MKIIVTPHRTAFLRWCRKNDCNPREVVFCNDSRRLYGPILTIGDVVWEHEWYKIPDIQEIIMSRVRHDSTPPATEERKQ